MPRYGTFGFVTIDDLDRQSDDNSSSLTNSGNDHKEIMNTGHVDQEIDGMPSEDGEHVASLSDGDVGERSSEREYGDWRFVSIPTADPKPKRKLKTSKTKKRVKGVKGKGNRKKEGGRLKRGERGKYRVGDGGLKEGENSVDIGKTQHSVKLTWGYVQRNRWRNAQVQATKKGIDFIPYDVYQALWEAAGVVETEWGEQVAAYQMQAKFYDERLRAIMIRFAEGPEHSYTRGNVGIVLVKGKYRNHRVPLAEPELYQVLATWDYGGEIKDRNGEVVQVLE